MLNFKLQIEKLKFDFAFIKHNEKIVNHPKLHAYLNQAAAEGKKRVERVSPRNIKERKNIKQRPIHQSVKIGKIRIFKDNTAGIEYKNVGISVFFKKNQNYYRYAIAGRRKTKDGREIIYKYQWALAVKYPLVDTWLNSKYQYSEAIHKLLREIMTEITGKNYNKGTHYEVD